jgi:molybdopterin-binding protein
MTLGEAAKVIGVSVYALRRWARQGRIQTRRDERNRRLTAVGEVQRLRGRPQRQRVGGQLSARNRLAGHVLSVEVGGVMVLVEIQAGPHRITPAITRDSAEELRLSEGQRVYARIQATNIMVSSTTAPRQTQRRRLRARAVI